MKKATLENIRTALLDAGFESTDPLMEEIESELNKGAAEKAAKAAEYESVHALIVDNLTSTPITAADLYNEIVDELPSGMSRYKIQHALNNLWQDEIVKIAGKPNTYRRA